jgi:hypothetical protein
MLTGRGLSFRRLQWVCAPVAAGGAILLGPGAALADDAPVITAGPVIAGLAQEGETLRARANWTGSPEPVAAWRWARCSRSKGSCSAITGARSDTYEPTSADVGSLLRVALTVTNTSGSAEKRSEPTAAVVGVPEPTPSPAPVPLPAPVPVPSAPDPPAPSFDLTPAPVTAPPVVGSPAPALRMLNPFPVVRIKGRLTARGARVTLLSVRAPRGSRIDVACRGTGCPVPKLARTAAVERLRRFERELRAGTRLEVTVTKPGAIGKWTLIAIRRGTVPRRQDGCVDSDTKRHVRCPA